LQLYIAVISNRCAELWWLSGPRHTPQHPGSNPSALGLFFGF